MDPHPTRIIIYACVTDIDGFPQRRHVKIGGDFCEIVLNRAFNPTLHPSGYDHIHIPADFDSQKPLKRWFILDLDVTQPLNQEDVLQLPHQVYLASQQSGKL
jgi:methylsterol monooxygenase